MTTTAQPISLVLAPMEGVTDSPMRALLSEVGGIDFCVSEFLRVSQEVPPARVIKHHVPEWAQGFKTPSGTPVIVQLLGGHAGRLAETARVAASIGATGIDLNFGCPAPTVNRHDGGATLLKFPERIEEIVRAVRTAVPANVTVSAKLRLGFDDPSAIFENALRAEDGGADWITIHGRTKTQGYTRPAYWKPIGEVKKRLKIPVIANGEIWNLEDFKRCREETGCDQFMLGRGLLANPSLALLIKQDLMQDHYTEPKVWWPLLKRFAELSLSDPEAVRKSLGPRYALARMKQWLKYAQIRRPLPWFEEIKRTQDLAEFGRFFGESFS